MNIAMRIITGVNFACIAGFAVSLIAQIITAHNYEPYFEDDPWFMSMMGFQVACIVFIGIRRILAQGDSAGSDEGISPHI